MIVEKKVHEIPQFVLQNGRTLRNVRFGYETYGDLAADKQNAILVLHYFSGTSHAAGRYQESDPEPGHWDALIGPGKAIDTNRFFVVSCDSLCNLNAFNPQVVTTGPASINPDSGRTYGADFPVVTIGDFVEAQNHLAQTLGIERWYAVAGPSMGAMQALEWSARFPAKAPRIIASISPGLSTEAYIIAGLSCWCAPITLDPAFKKGNYDLHEQPIEGLTQALKLVTLDALHFGVTRRQFARRWAESGQDPARELSSRYSIDVALENTAAQRARLADANSFLRLARAVQTFSIEDRKEQIRAKFLFLPAQSDILMFPEFPQRALTEFHRLGLSAEIFMIEGDGGHLDGLNQIGKASEPVRRFLST